MPEVKANIGFPLISGVSGGLLHLFDSEKLGSVSETAHGKCRERKCN